MDADALAALQAAVQEAIGLGAPPETIQPINDWINKAAAGESFKPETPPPPVPVQMPPPPDTTGLGGADTVSGGADTVSGAAGAGTTSGGGSKNA